jgi:peroxiredoxin
MRTQFNRLTKPILGALAASLCLLSVLAPPTRAARPPAVGDPAPEFALKALDGRSVRLSELTKEQPVVLIVLRGWPGYQCPMCSRQVKEFVDAAAQFKAVKAKVVMIYPGPSEELQTHAEDFVKDQVLPADFVFLLDPAYEFTLAYGLRWDAPGETAYPSTFIIDRARHVRFAKVSRTHGGRTQPAEVIEALQGLAD